MNGINILNPDVSMITLPKPFSFDAKINAACLPNDLRIFDEIIDDTWNGLEFTITGFGPHNAKNDYLPKLGFAQHSKAEFTYHLIRP